MNQRWQVLAVAALLWGDSAAFGATSDPVGIVKIISGDVVVVRRGSSIPSRLNEKLYAGDIVQTGAHGKAGLILEDDTVVSLGPKSKIAIEDFVFHPEKDELSLVARVFQGTVSFICGRIAKLAPNLVHIFLPHGTVGVRGTHILVRVD